LIIHWDSNQGPSIGGIYPLENAFINLSGFFQSVLHTLNLVYHKIQKQKSILKEDPLTGELIAIPKSIYA
jgi:hypothetical protein